MQWCADPAPNGWWLSISGIFNTVIEEVFTPQDLANAMNKCCFSFQKTDLPAPCCLHAILTWTQGSARHRNSISLETLKPNPSFSNLLEIQLPAGEDRAAPSEKRAELMSKDTQAKLT